MGTTFGIPMSDTTKKHEGYENFMKRKIAEAEQQRDEVKRTTDIFRGQIIDVGPATYVIQLTGPTEKLDSFVAALGDAEIMEVVRSGVAGMARGEKVLAP